MSNPYKPPESKVGDLREARIHASRPRAVGFACRLLCVTLGLSLLSLIPGVRADVWPPNQPPIDVLIELTVAGLLVWLEAWLIWLIYMQRNWARWLLLALLAISWDHLLSTVDESLQKSVTGFVIDSIEMVLELAACYQLFISPGRTWFDRPVD